MKPNGCTKLVSLDDVLRALDGIDRDEMHSVNGVDGWWQTSHGVRFGESVLNAIKDKAFECGE